ncbi:MAG: TIGR03084 family metal-binding protein [Actinobacteria bacterium]|nr:TIGR03084 family metal-binding protein [Actinomycetota bacterium]
MTSLETLLVDLTHEQQELDQVVATLDESAWRKPTPAEGWDIADTVGHLAYIDEVATSAVQDPESFEKSTKAVLSGEFDLIGEHLKRSRTMSGEAILAWWRRARQDMVAAFSELDPKARVPWYGPSMSVMSFVTARLMETWAHGQDVFDALGLKRQPTERLHHIALLGFNALGFSFIAHGLKPPDEPVRVELVSPSGQLWSWGDVNATNVVRGSALGFCLVVTQRRHIADTDLSTIGPIAKQWMEIAQAFAGPPGKGRSPGQFPRTTT